MAHVFLTEDAKEDLTDLDGSARKIVVKGLRKLQTDPNLRGQPLGSRPTGDLTGFRKLVVGDRQYRIVYRVEEDGTVVVVWVIGERTDMQCYDIAVSRLQLTADRKFAAEVEGVLSEMFTD